MSRIDIYVHDYARDGSYYVFHEKLKGGTGYTVRNFRSEVIYHLSKKSEAEAACKRLNDIDARGYAGSSKVKQE